MTRNHNNHQLPLTNSQKFNNYCFTTAPTKYVTDISDPKI